MEQFKAKASVAPKIQKSKNDAKKAQTPNEQDKVHVKTEVVQFACLLYMFCRG